MRYTRTNSLQKVYLLQIILMMILFSSCVARSTPESESLATATPPQANQAVLNNEDNVTPEDAGAIEGTDCANQQVLCVAFLVEAGLLVDNPFYQAAYSGAKRAEEDLLAQVNFFDIAAESQAADYAAQINSIADQGYDTIVTVGPNLLVGTLDAAENHPNTHFVGVDQNQFLAYRNFVGINFKAERAAFLAGALAAMVSNTETVGIVLGEVGPSVSRYVAGFEAGAHAVNPNGRIVYALYAGDVEDAYNDPKWGKESAQSLMGDGADVIFAAGGETAVSALNEVAASKNTLCIGADLDQYVESLESRPCLVSSIVRNIESEVFKMIALSKLDNFPTQNINGNYKFAPFYGFDQYLTADVVAFIDELEIDITNNSIPFDGTYILQNVPQVNIER